MVQCDFCNQNVLNNHLCSKLFSYEYIFKDFFLKIALDYKPLDYLDFFCKCMKIIHVEGLFSESVNPSDIVKENLIRFLGEYDCFT